MRIVHLADEYLPNSGYQETALAVRQRQLGHDVHVITGNRSGPTMKTLSNTLSASAGDFEHDGVKVHCLPVAFQLPGGAARVFLKGLADRLSELRPDIVHAHNFITFTGLQSVWFKPRIGYRLVFDNHQCLLNIRVPGTTPLTVFLRDLFYEIFRLVGSGLIRSGADAIVAVGENEQQYAAAYLGLPVENIPVIRLGADTHTLAPNPEIRQSQRAEWELKDTDFLAIYAGQFRPLRHLELLLQAAGQLVADGFPVYLVFVGAGYADYLAKLKGLAAQPLLAGRVRFLPLADKPTLARYFNAADLGVWTRGYSVTFIEALACGLPVLVEDSEYNRNTIKSAGYFFEPGSISSLSNELRAILNHRTRLASLRSLARSRVEEELNWDVAAQKFLAIYESTK